MIVETAPLVCIGCGCSSYDACISHRGTVRCAWLMVGGSTQASRGITYRPALCSACRPEHRRRWNDGDWTLSEQAFERALVAFARRVNAP